MSEFKNKLDEKDIYARYRDATTTPDNPAPNMFDFLTTVPKSKYDNVVGWIHSWERLNKNAR